MNEIELLIDFHKDAIRQGPGSEKETLRALDLINISDKQDLMVADIGCGSGSQTLTIAENIDGLITAVDLFPEFLQELDIRASKAGLIHKINTLNASMDDLPFDENTYDIIWSEGAIYNMGFNNGVRDWKKYLKPGGYLAVSEITWITDFRPIEIQEYWDKAYPEIDTTSNKMRVIEESGYSPVGYFVLPPYCWLDNYYAPMEGRFKSFLEKNNHSNMANKVVNQEREEIRIYRKYKEYYSYGFYVAKKI